MSPASAGPEGSRVLNYRAMDRATEAGAALSRPCQPASASPRRLQKPSWSLGSQGFWTREAKGNMKKRAGSTAGPRGTSPCQGLVCASAWDPAWTKRHVHVKHLVQNKLTARADRSELPMAPGQAVPESSSLLRSEQGCRPVFGRSPFCSLPSR